MQQESTETQSTKPLDEQSGKSTSKPKRKPATKKKSTAKKTTAKKTKTTKAAPKNEPSKGLGDTIQKITDATKLSALAKAIAGDDCGCAKRREKLNALFPYAQPMDDDSKHKWETIIKPAWNRNVLKRPEQLAFDPSVEAGVR